MIEFAQIYNIDKKTNNNNNLGNKTKQKPRQKCIIKEILKGIF